MSAMGNGAASGGTVSLLWTALLPVVPTAGAVVLTWWLGYRVLHPDVRARVPPVPRPGAQRSANIAPATQFQE